MALSHETDYRLPAIEGVETASPRKRWPADIRCPLPDHVLRSWRLLVDHNFINLKIMQATLRRIGCGSDTVSTPEEAILTYQNDPMKYNVVIMDPMRHHSVTGVDAFRQIREFESANGVPPCFLIASDGARSILMNLNGLRQKVLDSGVDCVLPWYQHMLPLYDALAGLEERPAWDRSRVVTRDSIAENTMGLGTAKSGQGIEESDRAVS
ncbi:uncharacterized protein M421DRAFT_422611 [Didymella exigua CBS 183.55]|uniref:Response regulatory domain-containing protein n=1 Tax=Didymella exigua CBS 183.55 TaxID=1150837 RepID=A0A6A5RM80_9PLEO|nr:uncharacterized protein M421DRAFT_422611 [Didymella exigua CBS 183.55]KAF1926647.1 hypothetical protein M421DRAFT_422611 [Didymella exigua CBS 183.55]